MAEEKKKTTTKKNTTKKSTVKKSTTKKETPKKSVPKKTTKKAVKKEEVKVETPVVEVETPVVEAPPVVEEVKTEEVKEKKNNSVIVAIVLVVVGLLLLIIAIIGIFVIPRLFSADIIVNQDYKIEVGNNTYLKDIVLTKKNIMLIEPLKYVDTNSIGEKELEVRYVKNRRENRIILKINVVDTTAPTIECDNRIEVFTTDDINEKIKEKVKIKDNDKDNLEFKIENLPSEDADPGEYSNRNTRCKWK